jgi:hypothetical protein
MLISDLRISADGRQGRVRGWHADIRIVMAGLRFKLMALSGFLKVLPPCFLALAGHAALRRARRLRGA